jgi:hypothetical protein
MKNRQCCPAPLEAVLRELENALVRYKDVTSPESETVTFCKGCHVGFESGIKRAIEIVNCEIGIRQNPPNIFYGMEKQNK